MKDRANDTGKGGRFSRKAKKLILPILCGSILAGGAIGAAVWLGDPSPEGVTVSVGLQQLAEGTYLAASAPEGQAVSFTPEWFDNTLGGSAVSAVTVTELPPVTEGCLMLGHAEVSVGQTIPRETLSYLQFIPANGVRKSSFSFTPETPDGGCSYALHCVLSVTAGKNCCPEAKGAVTAVSTHESITVSGTLAADDPDGDALHFEITQYPEGGILTLNAETGRYTYTPAEDFKGEDSFVWRVQDEHGGYSESSTVKVTVRELTTGYMFSDIIDGNLQTAALRVSEIGLLGGEQVGGRHYFHPKRELTRAAFVAVLVEAAGIKAEPADTTDFEDDAEIPHGMKGAIRYAKEAGWLGDETAFRPNEAITRAEAASIAAKALGLSAPGYHETVTDFSAIPVNVADAIYAIFEGGYIETLADGSLAPAATMTRADAAKFFANILNNQ